MVPKLKEFDEVIGQQGIVKWFKSCVARDHLPQVVMLTGPSGIGKTTIAKITACEIACKNSPEKLAEVKRVVIDESKSCDCVRLYNMSNLKSQDAVQEVKSDLSIGFTSTGRKVIIMDEAHGMSDEAQDSLLTTFESLQTQLYIIVCTTDVSHFRDAFRSRCVERRLTNLSTTEMRTFLKNRITYKGLKFELRADMVYSLISRYTGREPRRAINLIDSFEDGVTVTTAELETFFNVWEGKQTLVLIGYLYTGDILQGLRFIQDMDLDKTFKSTLLELLQVGQSGDTSLLSQDGIMHLRSLVNNNGLSNLLGFTIDCTTNSRLSRDTLSGYFLKWCTKANEIFSKPARLTKEQVSVDNIARMDGLVDGRQEIYSNNAVPTGMTLEQLMAEGETI